MEKRTIRFPVSNQPDRLIGDQVGSVALLINRLLVTMPVIDTENCGRIVRNRVVVVVDAPPVVAILVVEPLSHWELFGQPFTEMPLPEQGRLIPDLPERFGEGPLGGRKPMNPPGGCSIRQTGQLLPEQLQVAWFSEVLAPPIHPTPKRIPASQQGGPCRRADRSHQKLLKTSSFTGQPVDIRSECRITTIEAGIGPPKIVGQDQDDIRLRNRRDGRTTYQQQLEQWEPATNQRFAQFHGGLQSASCHFCSKMSQPPWLTFGVDPSGGNVPATACRNWAESFLIVSCKAGSASRFRNSRGSAS